MILRPSRNPPFLLAPPPPPKKINKKNNNKQKQKLEAETTAEWCNPYRVGNQTAAEPKYTRGDRGCSWKKCPTKAEASGMGYFFVKLCIAT